MDDPSEDHSDVAKGNIQTHPLDWASQALPAMGL